MRQYRILTLTRTICAAKDSRPALITLSFIAKTKLFQEKKPAITTTIKKKTLTVLIVNVKIKSHIHTHTHTPTHLLIKKS